MKASIFFLVFVLFGSSLSSQNLIPNASFELTNQEVNDQIALSQDDFNNKTKDWYSPTDASPDIYQVPTNNAQRPSNFRMIEAVDGKGLAGVILNGSSTDCKNYKEYIQIELKDTLVIGTNYRLDFWVSTRNSGLLEVGVLFSAKAIYSPSCSVMKQQPQFVFKDKLAKSTWKKVSYLFKANMAYTHLTIGNFSKEAKQGGNYCFLDHFQLSPLDIKNPAIAKSKEKKQENKPISSLPAKDVFNPANILFEHGKSTLTAKTVVELDKLVVYLHQYPQISIRLEGHTDETGTASFNQKLSLARAVRIMAYLTSKGLAHSRLSAIGYGATRPIADNDREEGAEQNRRVVFKIQAQLSNSIQ